MSPNMNVLQALRKLRKLLSSLKLAVFIMIGLAILTAVGTFVEAHYNDTLAASRLVYKTPWMYFLMVMLVVNLAAVMVDRWPWQKRHRSFIAAHIGIITLLIGSLVTFKFGLDGNLVIPVGGESRWVRLTDEEVTVWATFDGSNYSKVFSKKVDFWSSPLKKKPIEIPIEDTVLRITDYKPYVYSSQRIAQSSNTTHGPAIRFHLYNTQTSVNDWLLRESATKPASHVLGLAQVFLGHSIPEKVEGNELHLVPEGDSLKYAIFYRDGKKTRRGVIREAEEIETGWMGLNFRLLRYYPSAERVFDIEDAPRKGELTSSAILVEWDKEKHWVSLGDRFKIFRSNAAYLVNYSPVLVDLGFDVRLNKFDMGLYQGTSRAMSYKSTVEVPELGTAEISMNNPLKYQGKTLYQASFSQDEQGQITASVISVNEDPGRFLKYLGSLIISLGVVWLFIDRREAARKAVGPRSDSFVSGS